MPMIRHGFLGRASAHADVPRGALSVTAHEGKLYAIGGYDRTANSVAVEAYDPVRNLWVSRAPLPTGRDHLAAATVAGKIYAIGGRVDGDYHRNLSVTEVYDPATDSWARVADLPTARVGSLRLRWTVGSMCSAAKAGTARSMKTRHMIRHTTPGGHGTDADSASWSRVGCRGWTNLRDQRWADSRRLFQQSQRSLYTAEAPDRHGRGCDSLNLNNQSKPAQPAGS